MSGVSNGGLPGHRRRFGDTRWQIREKWLGISPTQRASPVIEEPGELRPRFDGMMGAYWAEGRRVALIRLVGRRIGWMSTANL